MKTLLVSEQGKIFFFVLVSRFSFELSLTLPTSERSYLSFVKYKLLKICSAISTVGASPGLKIL